MKSKLLVSLLVGVFSFAAHAAEPAKFVNGMLVAQNGMTLYTFDKDAANKSNCNDGCLKAWPALGATAEMKVAAPYGVITRDDGAKQITVNGKPLYLYVADQKPGDATGNNSGGVWHVVRSLKAAEAKPAAQASVGHSYSY